MASKVERIIIDTNLWISFLITKDFSPLDKLIVNQNVVVVFSEELLQEFNEVIARPKLKKYFKQKDIAELYHFMDSFGELVSVKSKVRLCRDAKDNFLLSLAIDSKASYLLTGDKDLLELKHVASTKIITLREYLSK